MLFSSTLCDFFFLVIIVSWFVSFIRIVSFFKGVPCDIYNVSSTEILCRTNPADDNILHVNATVFPGSRGITREVWNETAGEYV